MNQKTNSTRWVLRLQVTPSTAVTALSLTANSLALATQVCVLGSGLKQSLAHQRQQRRLQSLQLSGDLAATLAEVGRIAVHSLQDVSHAPG